MSQHDRTTLVLGAGASCSYGFPVGTTLRKSLLSLDAGQCNALGQSASAIKTFVHAFSRSQDDSIDAFLSKRSEYSEIGKAAIACAILRCESVERVFNESNEDNWYRYLLNTIAACPWEEFDPSWLSIVTFNYDRSFEFVLCESLQHRYGKTEDEVLDRMQSMAIVHVYGSLGSPWQRDRDCLPFFGRDPDYAEEHWVRAAASRIRVIPEGRDDDPSLRAAKALLEQAARICVLGFGFDDTNLRRIGAPEVFRIPGGPKRVHATALGLTPAETRRAAALMFGENYTKAFHAVRCRQLLRDTHVLFQ